MTRFQSDRLVGDEGGRGGNPAPFGLAVKERSGLLALPVVLIAYFAIGRVNVFPYRGIVDNSVLVLLAVAVVGYSAGVGLARLGWYTPPPNNCRTLVEPPGIRAFVRWWAALGGIAFALTIAAFKGIPLLVGEDERLQVSPRLTALAFSGVVALVALGALYHHKRWTFRRIIEIGGGCLLLFLLGYRTLPLLVVATLATIGWLEGRLRARPRTILLAAATVVGFSWAAVPRFGREESGGFFGPLYAQGMPSWFEPFAPIWLVPREGVAVLQVLQEKVPSYAPYENGRVFLSSFNFIDAGNLSAREHVAAAVGGRPGITITPSLLGQPYMDFGIAGVFFALLAIGFLLALLAFWQLRAATWAPRLVCGYFVALLLLDVHSGLLDPAPLVGLLVLTLFALRAERIVASRTSRELLNEVPHG